MPDEPPGSDGNSGKVAGDGKVAMAQDGDSEPVTRAMIAAGISQLPPMHRRAAQSSSAPACRSSRAPPGRYHGGRHGLRIAIPCHCHRAIGCHNATMANGTGGLVINAKPRTR
jgi:hypothetical protein